MSTSTPLKSSSLRRRNPGLIKVNKQQITHDPPPVADESSQDAKRVLSLHVLVLVGSFFLAACGWNILQPGREKEERAPVTINVQSTQDKATRDTCRIYMAPSSVKGVIGYGVYTTQPISQGELFLNGPDGPDILVTDFDYFPNDSLGFARSAWITVFDSYWWGRGVTDQIIYESNSSIDFQITFGSLPNHHCVLVRHSLP
jgi:hypothetical protein